MLTIASIVEGHSEVESLPILIQRVKQIVAPECFVRTPRPIRVSRDSVIKPRVFEKYMELAARDSGQGGRVLVLLDADDACPKEVAEALLDQSRTSRSDRTVKVVLAKSEFESWFVASIESIAGKSIDSAKGKFVIRDDTQCPANPEDIRDAKRWLSQRMLKGKSYHSTFHQPVIARKFDMDLARSRSRSFDKLWRDIETLILEK